MNYSLLSSGTLMRRYKRFLADVLLDDGREVTAHCANTGAMTGLKEEGARVWLSHHNNPRRKLVWSWELVEVITSEGSVLASVNTSRTNALVREALMAGKVLDNAPAMIKAEARVADARLDFKTEDANGQVTWIEVKQVTLLREGGVGAFPDAVSARALRHVEALVQRIEAGEQAMLLFCATHGGITSVRTAADIHPAYAEAVRKAVDRGVNVKAYGCRISPHAMTLTHPLPIVL